MWSNQCAVVWGKRSVGRAASPRIYGCGGDRPRRPTESAPITCYYDNEWMSISIPCTCRLLINMNDRGQMGPNHLKFLRLEPPGADHSVVCWCLLRLVSHANRSSILYWLQYFLVACHLRLTIIRGMCCVWRIRFLLRTRCQVESLSDNSPGNRTTHLNQRSIYIKYCVNAASAINLFII